MKADKQMIGFLFAGTPVERLGIQYLLHGQVVVIASPAPDAPAHKAFLRNHFSRYIRAPSQAVRGESIRACISRQKIRNFSFLFSLRVRCQTAFGQLTQTVSGKALACRKVSLWGIGSFFILHISIMFLPGGDIVRQPGIIVILGSRKDVFANHNALIFSFSSACAWSILWSSP